jgi:hypothetical protein
MKIVMAEAAPYLSAVRMGKGQRTIGYACVDSKEKFVKVRSDVEMNLDRFDFA